MSQLALDLGVPSTLVTEAVYARCLSALKDGRVRASKVLQRPVGQVRRRPKEFIEQIRQALYASKICSYAQGFVQCRRPRTNTSGRSTTATCAMLWRGGCIIRAVFLDRIKEAFDADPKLENLLLAPYFTKAVEKAQDSWRHVVATAARAGHSGAGVRDSPGLLRRLPPRPPAGQPAAGPARSSAPTPTSTLDKPGTFHTDWIRERKEPGK